MPRSKRLLYDDACYHVVQRGHNKDILFIQTGDYLVFKNAMRKYLKDIPVSIYHYCLMTNHFHLVVRIKESHNLPRFMQAIAQTYSKHYKRTYNHTGYLYQNRYKSYNIDNDAYLLECGRYIERNPIRAGIVSDLGDYRWSSYNFYAKGKKDDIITINPAYLALCEDIVKRQELYKEYVAQERIYENLIDKALMGK